METKTREKATEPVKLQLTNAAAAPGILTAVGMNEIALSRMIFFLAMGVGTFLRIWQINANGFNTDEAVYAGQAAAISGVSGLKDIFPIFRAHPLLVQFILSLIYRIHFSDLAGRLLAVVIGLGTVYLTYLIGRALYGRLAGSLAAAILAVMPYHVVVSRQFLLDGPMVFFATLTLYMLVRFGKSHKGVWLYAAGVTMGLTFLSKETSIILMAGIYIFLALSPEVHVRLRDLFISTILAALVILPFPLTLMLAGGTNTGRNYLTWQLFRRPNHPWYFYLQVIPPALGILTLVIAILGLVLLWRERSWREKLLLSWIFVPIAFFQLWPVKGYQYLLPIAPVVALLAGGFLGRILTRVPNLRISGRAPIYLSIPPVVSWLVVGVLAVSLSAASWQRILPETSSIFLAGTGGVPGGREAGDWIQQNVPEGATFLTIGPSMANIVEFYGQRKAYGLSVSPNPLRRNPSYEPIINPDAQIRNSDLQYLVWDSFSAARSQFFSDKLLGYVNKYNGRVVHTESINIVDSKGNPVTQPVIIIYEVHP
jgi:4-amino-4-deoxy-L-arabinose transferase-like glycosyltransferase